MPPPPVAGAAVGIARAVRVRVADGRALELGDADGRGLELGDADGLGLGDLRVRLGLGEVLALAETLAEMLAEADALAPGDNFGNVVDGDDVQAATAADTSTAVKPAAVSLAMNPVPAIVRRIFTRCLEAPGNIAGNRFL